jgi:hypothetical protein
VSKKAGTLQAEGLVDRRVSEAVLFDISLARLLHFDELIISSKGRG